jgi:penicillin-binding protein 1A
VARAADVLIPGDMVYVEALAATAAPGKRVVAPASYGPQQVPDVSGGFTAMDPKTGRDFALVGGWDYRESQFDRAVQAKRQPGSAIKPFVYLTALQGDFTPSSIIQDAPIELPQGPGMSVWSPANYEGNYVGSTTLRQALVHSRNLATARLAATIGLPAIARTIERFGIMDKMPLYYSMALGAGDTTLLRLTAAYAMIDNGGRWLLPTIIDLVQDRHGRIVYQKGTRDCAACYIVAGIRPDHPDIDPGYAAVGAPDPSMIYLPGVQFAEKPLLYKPTKLDNLVDPVADRQIVSMMEGVVQHGTGIKVATVGKPLAGKTGTSSEWFDAWFVGFSPHIAAGAYVGFDTPRTLGDGETGGNVAAPIFRDFMADALRDAPALPFTDPPGAEMVLVNAISGQPTSAGDRDSILETFRPGTAPGSGYNPSTAPLASGQDQTTAVASSGGLPVGSVLAPPNEYAASSAFGTPQVVYGSSPGGPTAPPGRPGPGSPRMVLTGTGGLY